MSPEPSLAVSMESGLEDRNNFVRDLWYAGYLEVSMESGLEDRNNIKKDVEETKKAISLNGVRPRRPEQSMGDSVTACCMD